MSPESLYMCPLSGTFGALGPRRYPRVLPRGPAVQRLLEAELRWHDTLSKTLRVADRVDHWSTDICVSDQPNADLVMSHTVTGR
jgi:hypothetical protein